MSSSGISRDLWLKALEDVGESQTNDPDAITITEFADTFGLLRQAAARQLETLTKAGKAIRTRKKAKALNGHMVSHIAYRLVMPTSKKRA